MKEAIIKLDKKSSFISIPIIKHLAYSNRYFFESIPFSSENMSCKLSGNQVVEWDLSNDLSS